MKNTTSFPSDILDALSSIFYSAKFVNLQEIGVRISSKSRIIEEHLRWVDADVSRYENAPVWLQEAGFAPALPIHTLQELVDVLSDYFHADRADDLEEFRDILCLY